MGKKRRTRPSASQHAIERVSHRHGDNTWVSEQLILTAYKEGRRLKDFTKRERDYVAAKQRDHGNEAVIYADMCFIFSPDKHCITAFNTPSWFGTGKLPFPKSYGTNTGQPIKKIRTYHRMNGYEDYYEYDDYLDDYDYGAAYA